MRPAWALVLAAAWTAGCGGAPTRAPETIVLGTPNSPTSLDPGIGLATSPRPPAPNFQPNPNEVHADPESLPTIFTAIQEKLGLRLERQRAEVEVLVIDSADKPK